MKCSNQIPLTDISGDEPQRSQCINANGCEEMEVEIENGNFLLLPIWHFVQIVESLIEQSTGKLKAELRC